MPAHDPVVNPSVHYLGVVGTTTIWRDHALCEDQWERIKLERSSEYGTDGAYNFGGCNSHGIRMEGRGWNRDSAANGGEDGVWYNAGSRALCILVGTDDIITEQCQEMIRVFANEAVDQHGMQWPLRGHSEFVATSCPGDNLRAVIANINVNPNPAPEPAPIRKDQDVIYKEENGQYWQMGFGDYVLLPEKVGVGVALNGGAVVPITTAERIAMGVAAENQAKTFLKKVGVIS